MEITRYLYKTNLPSGVVVFDNGGKTMDRYTVFIKKDIYGMSKNPTSPQGFNQYIGDIFEIEDFKEYLNRIGKRIYIVPDKLLLGIKLRIRILYRMSMNSDMIEEEDYTVEDLVEDIGEKDGNNKEEAKGLD
jgi:hypothetical protein